MSNQPNLQALEQQARAAMIADNMLSTYKTYRLIFTISASVILVGFIISIGIAVLATDENCYKDDIPLRTVLYIYLFLFSFKFMYIVALEILIWRGSFNESSALSKGFSYIIAIVGCFSLGMLIVSCVVVFDNDSCEDDFQFGYIIMFSIIVLNIVSIVLVCCIVCCCACFLIRLKKHGEREDDSGIGENNNI